MSPLDGSEIDNAVVALLGSDAALLALLPNGVYLDEAPAGSTRFVIVSLVPSPDTAIFGARAFEEPLYLVKAVGLSVINGVPLPPTTMKAAAARIDALLEDGTVLVAGYAPITLHRVMRIRALEMDDLDPSIRWFHRGGRYQAMGAPA